VVEMLKGEERKRPWGKGALTSIGLGSRQEGRQKTARTIASEKVASKRAKPKVLRGGGAGTSRGI